MSWIEYLIVLFVGGIACIFELAILKKNKRIRLFLIPSAWVYLSVNIIFCLIVYWGLKDQNIKFQGVNISFETHNILFVFVASIASLAIVRSSFIKLKKGENDFELGIWAIGKVLSKKAEEAFIIDVRNENLMRASELFKKHDFGDLSGLCEFLNFLHGDEGARKFTQISTELKKNNPTNLNFKLCLILEQFGWRNVSCYVKSRQHEEAEDKKTKRINDLEKRYPKGTNEDN